VTRIGDVMAWLDTHAPFRYTADWDNSGLQVGDPDAEVTRILVALDVTPVTLTEAETTCCQCLVTHHPLLFQPLKTLRFDQSPAATIARAIKNGIHLIAAHTNLDVASDGTNQHLVRMLGLHRCQPLETDPRWQGEERYAGMGAVGDLPEAATLQLFVARLQRLFPTVSLRVVGDGDRVLRRIALCTGSGASFLERVIAVGCDAYVSGDFKYHEARRAEEAGLALVDLGHFASEQLVVEPLAQALRQAAARAASQVEIMTARSERDPFIIGFGQGV
jgi:dinuclear metal center YbgI/SA1388 family protein